MRAPAPTHETRLLLVDDDPLVVESLAFVLGEHFHVHCAGTRAEARAAVRAVEGAPLLALVDLGLPPEPHSPSEGFALIGELLAANPRMKILVLSGQGRRENIQHALTLGAVDFITKPVDGALLSARLQHQVMMAEVEQQLEARQAGPDGMIGDSQAMQALRREIERFADTPFPVLIQGESGAGKELVARALHTRSERRDAPFVTVNCAAFTPQLLEAQLFGHQKGAYTGAAAARTGFFGDAGRGTLLLDEIAEFPMELQPKLLRVLENGEYYRIGETRPRLAEARILAATNRDLQEEIRAGRFRHDLYHRLGVLTVTVPPLRAREEDSLALLEHFLALYAQDVKPFTLDEQARGRWVRYPFPGNVRELRNIVIRLGAKHPGRRVGLFELEPELDSHTEVDSATLAQLGEGSFSLDDILSKWEQRYIDAALKLSNGNLSEAARLLGVNRTTLYSKIQRLSGAGGA